MGCFLRNRAPKIESNHRFAPLSFFEVCPYSPSLASLFVVCVCVFLFLIETTTSDLSVSVIAGSRRQHDSVIK